MMHSPRLANPPNLSGFVLIFDRNAFAFTTEHSSEAGCIDGCCKRLDFALLNTTERLETHKNRGMPYIY